MKLNEELEDHEGEIECALNLSQLKCLELAKWLINQGSCECCAGRTLVLLAGWLTWVKEVPEELQEKLDELRAIVMAGTKEED